MHINYTNRLMRGALFCALLIGYQAELKPAASPSLIMTEFLVEADAVRNFMLGFSIGSWVNFSVICATKRAKGSDYYWPMAFGTTVMVSLLSQFVRYLGVGIDQPFMAGFAGGVCASLFNEVLFTSKHEEEVAQELANLKSDKDRRCSAEFDMRLLERIVGQRDMQIREQEHVLTELTTELERVQGQQIKERERMLREFTIELERLRERAFILAEQNSELQGSLHGHEKERKGFLTHLDELAHEANRSTDMINELNAVIHAIMSAYELGAQGAIGETKTCLVCFEEKNMADFVRLFCGHDDACKECVSSGIEMMLRSKDAKHAACSHPDCGKALMPADFFGTYALDLNDIIIGQTRLDYQLNSFVSGLLDERNEIEYQGHFNALGGQACPGVDCSFRYIKEKEQRFIVCARCKLQFCSHCRNEHTEELTCEQAALAKVPDAAIAASEAFIQASMVSCPQCKVPVERGDGCNHMTCTNCPAHFCYNCKSALPVDPYRDDNIFLSCGCVTWPIQDQDEQQEH